jgi:hypothetical protein
MRHWRLIAVVAAGLALSAHLGAQKQGQLFISLTAADGKPVDGLLPDEVSITEDGAACKTLKLEAINWPTKVHVLVDNGRPNTNPINPLRDGLKAFFAAMPDGTEMSMYATAGTPRPIVKLTADRQKLVDGIALIVPDNSTGMFFDAFSEAADRIEKDNKAPHFDVILMVGSDLGVTRVLDREYAKLQQTIFNHGVPTYVALTVGQGGSAGGGQVDMGIELAKLAGGRFENIGSASRLATLLPEFGKQIAESIARQSHQYRITYERPAKPNERAAIGAQIQRDGAVRISLHGNQ